MENRKPWHEDDAYWETFGPMMFGQHRWDAAPTEVEQLIALTGIEADCSLLDLCCGPGRHALELARRGFEVTGVDRNPAYLAEAQRRADAESLDVTFIREDMRSFCQPDSFNAAINMFTAFGYFEDEDENRQVAANLHRSLKDSGKLVMEMRGKETLARDFRERDWHRGEDGSIMLEERKPTRNWTWIENTWILLEGESRREFALSLRIYSAAELAALLMDAGFSSVDAFGGLDGSPYDHQARRLVVVARK